MANLSSLLEKEASAEIEAILSEARERASEIVAEAKEDAEATTAQQKRTAETQYDAALVRARSSAQLEASSLKLRAQHEAVEDVFQSAHDDLESIKDKKDDNYTGILEGLLSEALDGIGGAKNVGAILVNPDDKEAAEQVAAKHDLKGKVETDEEIVGGVRVRGAGGHMRLENTLYGRLESAREELTSEVSKILFGSASPTVEGGTAKAETDAGKSNGNSGSNSGSNSDGDSKVVSKAEAESAPDTSAEV